jgi:hypothetical protein
MSGHAPRRLTPTTPQGPRKWKVVGENRTHLSTFCGGGPTEAVVGCPDENGPFIFQVAVCGPCLVDTIMSRFAAVKHERTVALARDMSAAADEIIALRSQRDKRNPAELRAEELRIREKHGLLEDTELHDSTRRGSPLL